MPDRKASSLRMSLRKLIAGILGLLFVTGVLAVGAPVFLLYDSVLNARERVASAVGMASSLNLDGIGTALDEFLDYTGAAVAITEGPAWSTLEGFPGFGEDAVAVAETVRVVDDLGSEARDAFRLAELDNGLAAFVPREGAVDIALLETASQSLVSLTAATEDAERRLSSLSNGDLHGPVRSSVDLVRDAVKAVAAGLPEASASLELLGRALGADGDRRILVVVRDAGVDWASGGAPVSVVEMQVSEGRFQFLDVYRSSTVIEARTSVVDDPVAIAMGDEPVAATSAGFPSLAAAIKEGWLAATGRPVDAVVALDSLGLARLARLAGETEFNRDGIVELFSVVQDADVDGARAAFLERTFSSFFDAAGGASEYRTTVDALLRERSVVVWSAHPDEQEMLSRVRSVSGLASDGPDVVTVFMSGATPDATGGAPLEVGLQYCPAASQLTVTVDMPGASPAASDVRILGPSGSSAADAVGAVGTGPLVAVSPRDGVAVFEGLASAPAVLAPSRLGGMSVFNSQGCG